jgi:hypothetical protein
MTSMQDGLVGSGCFRKQIELESSNSIAAGGMTSNSDILAFQDVVSGMTHCEEGVAAELFPYASGWRLVWPESRLSCSCMARTYANERDRTCITTRV